MFIYRIHTFNVSFVYNNLKSNYLSSLRAFRPLWGWEKVWPAGLREQSPCFRRLPAHGVLWTCA